MMTRCCRKNHLPVLSLLCIVALFTGPFVVHAGTVPNATVNTLQLRADQHSSSPGRQAYSRTGAEFEVLGAPPAIAGNTDADMGVPVTVDINTASIDELAAALPGIGPGKAQRIVDWREANGPFQFIDQLLEVSGIGPVTLENIRPFVRIGDTVSMQRNPGGQSTQEQAVILALASVIRRAVRDREKAIQFAFEQAKKGDTVILLGKGHEKTIERAIGSGGKPDSDNPWEEHSWDEIGLAKKLAKKL